VADIRSIDILATVPLERLLIRASGVNFKEHFVEEATHCTSYVSVRDEPLRDTEDTSFHDVAWLTKIEQVRMHRIF